MKITIDEEVCEKNKLPLEKLLVILLVKGGINIREILTEMTKDKMLIRDSNIAGKYLVTQRWSNLSTDILLKSDNSIPSEDALIELALSLMELFPKGKKEGTNCYWRGNRNDIKGKLQKFFKLYGNKYTDSQIIEATRSYVKSFNGNYSYMRILKYFIWKAERKVGENGKMYIEETSDLASFIENEGQDNSNSEWTTTLV